MGFMFMLPLRATQIVFAIIVLGLTAYLTDASNGYNSRINFLLFTSIWTLLVTAYLVIAPTRFPGAAHKFAIVGAEFVTMIFWFAGFVALAVAIHDSYCHSVKSTFCGSARAATVFAAFEWGLFLSSTILAALHCWRTRNSSDNSADPQMRVNTSV